MRFKAKVFGIVLAIATAINAGACTPEVNLPVLYKAPDFALTNQNGREVKLSDFHGKVIVLNFFYSRCPDICGEENYRLQDAWKLVQAGSKSDLNFVSVSFDSFDTPDILKQYAAFFDVPGWQFLSGTSEQVQQVTNHYSVGYEQDAGGANITHSVSIVLIDREGMVRKTYGSPEFPVKDMTRELEYILEN